MLNRAISLEHTREYLADSLYALVDQRLAAEAYTRCSFPPFQELQQRAAELPLTQQVLVKLFRLGEHVDAASVATAIPPEVLQEFSGAGLLLQQGDSRWATPGLVLVPVESAHVFVSTPLAYPTTNGRWDVWFDLWSHHIARCLPPAFTGEQVLDICCGSGVLAILCAMRGATHATGLEINARAVEVARLNATLNGVHLRTTFMSSDGLSAVGAQQKFDFVVCNPPSTPMIRYPRDAQAPETIGNSVLRSMLSSLPSVLSEAAHGLLAAWCSLGYHGSTWQQAHFEAVLVAAGCAVTSYVERVPQSAESALTYLQRDLAQYFPANEWPEISARVQRLIGARAGQFDGLYNQIIRFRRKTDTQRTARQ